jgi:hypothetical protein
MEREIGSSYPLHIGILSPVELYTKYVNLSEVYGIYLRYLLAAVSNKNQKVNLIFGPSLDPQILRVVTIDGKEIQDWKLDDFDKYDFEKLCKEFELIPSETPIEKFAKTLLLKIAPNHMVPVPAYRFVSDGKAEQAF